MQSVLRVIATLPRAVAYGLALNEDAIVGLSIFENPEGQPPL
jgi:hypothetical protein